VIVTGVCDDEFASWSIMVPDEEELEIRAAAADAPSAVA